MLLLADEQRWWDSWYDSGSAVVIIARRPFRQEGRGRIAAATTFVRGAPRGAMLRAAAALLLSGTLCLADIAPLAPHSQTPGVLTCTELGGVCRVPEGPPCPDGEVAHAYNVRCDSGCGYWRGRCGQPCCVAAGYTEEVAVLESPVWAPGGTATSQLQLAAEVVCTAGVVMLVVALARFARPPETQGSRVEMRAAE